METCDRLSLSYFILGKLAVRDRAVWRLMENEVEDVSRKPSEC
jgi:hypothetical protein